MKIVKTILSLLLGFILVFGTYKAYTVLKSGAELRANGKRVLGFVTETWRGRCAQGYGNSAVVTFRIGGTLVTDTVFCTVDRLIATGDSCMVLYDSSDYRSNKIFPR